MYKWLEANAFCQKRDKITETNIQTKYLKTNKTYNYSETVNGQQQVLLVNSNV